MNSLSVKSMTAFARLQSDLEQGSLHWELRAVNQRYLEINLKLPETFRPLEMRIRETIKQHLARGKIDVTLTVDLPTNAEALQIDHAMLQSLSAAICTVQQTLIEASHVNPLEILKWPGILNQELSHHEQAVAQNESKILQALDSVLEQLNAHRSREGQALAQIIIERCQLIKAQVSYLQEIMPEILQQQSAKLTQRILTLTAQLDENRLHQEVAILAQKMDIEEELDRILTHLTEVAHILHSQGPIGRRLDFLMQELNREANTLGSKGVDSRISQSSIELKVLIEQIREQVQNIE